MPRERRRGGGRKGGGEGEGADGDGKVRMQVGVSLCVDTVQRESWR